MSLYAALVQERLSCIPPSANTVYDLEKAAVAVNDVLTEFADECSKKTAQS